jgi:hypothetical protein
MGYLQMAGAWPVRLNPGRFRWDEARIHVPAQTSMSPPTTTAAPAASNHHSQRIGRRAGTVLLPLWFC